MASDERTVQDSPMPVTASRRPLSTTETARELGITVSDVYTLIIRSQLIAEKGKDPRRPGREHWQIDRDSVSKLKAKRRKR